MYVNREFIVGQFLSASFLQSLLTEKNLFHEDVEEDRRKVHIENAVLTEPLNLVNMDILHEIEFINCQFEDTVDVAKSTFYKRTTFTNSSFLVVNLSEATFKGPVS